MFWPLWEGHPTWWFSCSLEPCLPFEVTLLLSLKGIVVLHLPSPSRSFSGPPFALPRGPPFHPRPFSFAVSEPDRAWPFLLWSGLDGSLSPFRASEQSLYPDPPPPGSLVLFSCDFLHCPAFHRFFSFHLCNAPFLLGRSLARLKNLPPTLPLNHFPPPQVEP